MNSRHNAIDWQATHLPDLTGKTIIVTGANSGIGFETAKALALKGAQVVLACRSLEKGRHAAQRIQEQQATACVDCLPLDLADLKSIRDFSQVVLARYPQVDVLINNAGVMHLPYRQTADGFEIQFGTNHLGHFALTGLLIGRLMRTGQARVVTVSSMLHRGGKIHFEDLNGEKSYDRRTAYSQSKLANLLFAYELQRKLVARHSEVISVASHPGYAATNLQFAGPRMDNSRLGVWGYQLMNRVVAQDAAMGALPSLYAAVQPEVVGCDFIGPGGFMEMRGLPVKQYSSQLSYDQALAGMLWEASERLTGINYTFETQ